MGQNPTEEELIDMINEVDIDGNGKLDFEEFCSLSQRINKEGAGQEEELLERFNMFDQDGNGLIDRDELTTVMR